MGFPKGGAGVNGFVDEPQGAVEIAALEGGVGGAEGEGGAEEALGNEQQKGDGNADDDVA